MSAIRVSPAGRPGDLPPLSPQILRLVASGKETTRTGLSRALGASPSTVSAAVGALLARGLIAEQGLQPSKGGRPRRVLRLGQEEDYAIAADLGAHHVRVGVVRPGGLLGQTENVPFDMSAGPEACLRRLSDVFRQVADVQGSKHWRSVGLSIPGPVDATSGTVELPSRMPGWNTFPVTAWLEDELALPAVIGNDANCMAIAEHSVIADQPRQMIFVKAGSAIGTGIIVDGKVYHGATGVAGDITHVRIAAAGAVPCSCGNTGCLETIASGLALVRALQEQGLVVENVQDVVQLVAAANPAATQAVRHAGQHLGEVLAANVNFFNPDVVVLGGVLGTLESFVASVRSRLYKDCHPLVTRSLVISRSLLGQDAGVVGAGRWALEAAVNRTLSSATQRSNSPN